VGVELVLRDRPDDDRGDVLAEALVRNPDHRDLPDGRVRGKDVLDLRQVRNDAEKHAIQIALTQSGGNLSRMAGLLGVSRPTLYDLLDKHGLKRSTNAE